MSRFIKGDRTMSAALQKDAYKIAHKEMYPDNTTFLYSNFTARSGLHSNIPESKGVTFVGLQHTLVEYFIDDWNYSFFTRPKKKVIAKYKRIVEAMVGEVDISHIEALHDLGYLPLEIKALPEGSFVPYGVPMITIKNTLPEFFWVVNMIESVLSAEIWQPITSATTYMAYKALAHKYADITGADKSFIPYQIHDFSFRGMSSRQAAAKSAFAVLACGSLGTDCIPAIDLAEEYYYADVTKEVVGTSIKGTEHSIMCCGTKEGELETYRRLITEVVPDGMIAIVSDTWDFWKVVTEYLVELKPEIMVREGKLVIRPDSGDPVRVICGCSFTDWSPEKKGLIEVLWDIFGGTINEAGYKVLDSHIGAIYGDSITYDRAEKIFKRLEEKGFASSNIVLGVGSYTYQMQSRDTHGFAMKATYTIINGEGASIFKDPITDSGIKKSAKGLLRVDKVDGKYTLTQEVSVEEEEKGCLEVVFKDGVLVKSTTLNEIRELTKVNSYERD
jgi:nicotinamide phosphoribosyltransferase